MDTKGASTVNLGVLGVLRGDSAPLRASEIRL